MIRRISVIDNLCVVLAVGAAVLMLKVASADPALPPDKRKVFTDSVKLLPPPPAHRPDGLDVQAAAAADKKESMDLLFSLAIPKQAQKKLEDAVAKGEVISREKIARDYSPKQEDVDALTKYLKSRGFEITKITPNRTSVYAKATAAEIEKALQVEMVKVVKGGVTYIAAQERASLPMKAAAGVHAIIGLQPFRQAIKRDEKASPGDGKPSRETPPGVAPEGGRSATAS